MTDHNIATVNQIPDLGSQSDDALVALIGNAKALLAARQRDRCRKATAEIRRLARAHGLDVTVTGQQNTRSTRRSKKKAV